MKIKINVNNIYAGYNGITILSGISFALNESGFIGVIGPNGCGKTTLLRSMSRALLPINGNVELDGKDIYSISARDFAKKVAVVPQDTLVAFDFTVLEIVLMGRNPRLGRFAVESTKDISIAEQALERTGTLHLKDRQINSLSGGERQRIMMSRALAQEPEVLLLDEPTSHLDISYQFEILSLVKELNRENGLTVLAVLHDLNLASQYCDNLIMIGQGRVQASGTPDEVITADSIRKVYGAEVWVRRHPANKRPYVIAGVKSAKKINDDFKEMLSVHVIGGGGTAAPILATLIRKGYSLSCGVLVDGDADQEVAEALDIPYISQKPFSHITAESHSKHIEILNKSDIVVLTDVPIGNGNILNIEAANDAVNNGKKVVLLRPDLVAGRDFTEGKAPQIFKNMLNGGALQVKTIDELTSLLDTIDTN